MFKITHKMPYTLTLTDKTVTLTDTDVYDYLLKIDKKRVIALNKSYSYDNITSLCLYSNEFPTTDYISNYTTLSNMYGPNPITELDIKLINYLKSVDDDIKTDLGKQCCTMSDNIPCDWVIYFSRTNSAKRYVNTGTSWLVFSSEDEMDNYADSLDM